MIWTPLQFQPLSSVVFIPWILNSTGLQDNKTKNSPNNHKEQLFTTLRLWHPTKAGPVQVAAQDPSAMITTLMLSLPLLIHLPRHHGLQCAIATTPHVTAWSLNVTAQTVHAQSLLCHSESPFLTRLSKFEYQKRLGETSETKQLEQLPIQ